MPRYWQDRVWSTMTDFRREAGLARTTRHDSVVRNLALLAAYLGSPATSTSLAINVAEADLRSMMDGRLAPTMMELERLHDWIAACLWRHLWRAGSPEHATAEAIEEAVTHAARLAEIPPEWIRDWTYAASEVVP
jgi:hypothetical protein